MDDPIAPSSAMTAGDAGAHSAADSGSNTGEEEDWGKMDSASDLDAAVNALHVADSGATVCGGGGRKLSNKKERSPYLQDPHPLCIRRSCRNDLLVHRRVRFSSSSDR